MGPSDQGRPLFRGTLSCDTFYNLICEDTFAEVLRYTLLLYTLKLSTHPLKYNLVHRKCNLAIPTAVPMCHNFTVIITVILQ